MLFRSNTQSSMDKETVRQSVVMSPLSGSDLEFLRGGFSVVDSSVLSWKVSGYVPDVWEGLSDIDLSALIMYLNGAHSNDKILDIMYDNKVFGPISSKNLRELIRKGLKEILELYKISEEEVRMMTWEKLATKTIYKIPKNAR